MPLLSGGAIVSDRMVSGVLPAVRGDVRWAVAGVLWGGLVVPIGPALRGA